MEDKQFLSLLDQLGDISPKKLATTITSIYTTLCKPLLTADNHPLIKKYTNDNYGEGITPNINYTLTRAINGLSSTSQEQKHGFFILLVYLLSHIEQIDIEKLLATIKKETEVLKSDGKMEAKNNLLGRILSYKAIICSNKHIHHVEAIANELLQIYRKEEWAQNAIANTLYAIKKTKDNALSKLIYSYAFQNKMASKMYESKANFNLLCLAKTKTMKDLTSAEHKLIIDPIYDKNKIGQMKTLLNTIKIEKQECIGVFIMIENLEEEALKSYWTNVLEPTLEKESTTKSELYWKHQFLYTHLSLAKSNVWGELAASPITMNQINSILTQNVQLQPSLIKLFEQRSKECAYALLKGLFCSEQSLSVKRNAKIYSILSKNLTAQEVTEYVSHLIGQLEKQEDPKEAIGGFVSQITTLFKNLGKLKASELKICKNVFDLCLKHAQDQPKLIYIISEAILSIPLESVIGLVRKVKHTIDATGLRKYYYG